LLVASGVFAILLAACQSMPQDPLPQPGVTHVVVDTDMGTDDVMALLYLLQRPDVLVDAVAVEGDGLAHCRRGVHNARALLSLAGAPSTPVACGRGAPLQGANAFPADWRAFSDDLSAVPDLPEPSGDQYEGTAADLLTETLDGDAVLLTLGPLTNVAEALRADAALAARVPRVVSMAGAVDVPGNAPNGVAEYNVWIDPLAAKESIAALPVTLVPLDVTNQVPATTFFVDALGRHPATPEARAIHALLVDNPQIAAGQYFFWDPLAAVLLVEPGLGTYEEARVLVTASLDAGAGWISRWDSGVRVRLADDADTLAFEREYLSTLTGETVEDLRPPPELTIAFDGRRCRTDVGVVEAGELVIAFDNDSQQSVSALVGSLHGITYERLLASVGSPGSVVRKAPEEFVPSGFLVAEPGASTLVAVEVGAGAWGIFCLIEVGGDAARVWPGGPLTVS
jgi:pyrimidine-specific ribonucleoside hydrolase